SGSSSIIRNRGRWNQPDARRGSRLQTDRGPSYLSPIIARYPLYLGPDLSSYSKAGGTNGRTGKIDAADGSL
ncbi:hypothetical protein LJB63_24775, partial [[Eubacterium] rectale]|nr:hypothetical protein [Agathobacter rectalis]